MRLKDEEKEKRRRMMIFLMLVIMMGKDGKGDLKMWRSRVFPGEREI